MVNVAGGAAAKQIVTGYHKILVLKGFKRVYEIGKPKSMFIFIYNIDSEHATAVLLLIYTYVNWYHNAFYRR